MRRLGHAPRRFAVFLAVGAFCFAVQLALLTLVTRLGADKPVANAIGFALSAQLNFLLSSRLTWRDRKAAGRRDAGVRWLAYNTTALLSLACNTVVFTLTYKDIGAWAAALLGVLAGTAIVFLTCNFVIFRMRRPTARTGVPPTAGVLAKTAVLAEAAPRQTQAVR
jgi:putative flippase GtrA